MCQQEKVALETDQQYQKSPYRGYLPVTKMGIRMRRLSAILLFCKIREMRLTLFGLTGNLVTHDPLVVFFWERNFRTTIKLN